MTWLTQCNGPNDALIFQVCLYDPAMSLSSVARLLLLFLSGAKTATVSLPAVLVVTSGQPQLLGWIRSRNGRTKGHSQSHQHGEHDEECTQTDCTASSHSHDHSHSADSSCHDPHCDDTTHSHDSKSEHSSCSDPDCSDSSHTHEHSHDHSSECSDAGKKYRA